MLAAILAIGPPAVASHWTAARLWGLPESRSQREGTARQQRPQRNAPNKLVLTFPRQRTLTGVTVHRRTLPTWQRTVYEGVPVTTPARTVVDLAGQVDQDALAAFADDLIRRNLLRLEQLRTITSTLASARGYDRGALRQLLAERLPGYLPGDSDWERRMDASYDEWGLPPAIRQYEIRAGGRTYRVDRAIPELRIAIEWNGYRWHGARTSFDADADREADLAAIGWQLLGFTSRTSPERIRAAVLGAVARRLNEGPYDAPSPARRQRR